MRRPGYGNGEATLEDVVSDHENGMGYRKNGLLSTATGRQTKILSGEIGVFGFTGSVYSLD